MSLFNLAGIVDPERLERLAHAANTAMNHASRKLALRTKVALRQYAAAVTYRLEHAEEL